VVIALHVAAAGLLGLSGAYGAATFTRVKLRTDLCCNPVTAAEARVQARELNDTTHDRARVALDGNKS
jgi:hypothetical protein